MVARFLCGLIVLCLGLAGVGQAARSASLDTITILISIDGMRWDYPERHEAPRLRALAGEGVRARRMRVSFPSKTFPNHYTLVTGLRPETHGIVGNSFFDGDGEAKFDMRKTETHWWAGGEPVWITAEKQGVRSACFFWPGSEVVLQGRRPSQFVEFNKSLTNGQRVDGLLAWFDLPAAQRPRFATLYFDSVDTAGHRHGPESPLTAAAVKEADAMLGRLLDGLASRGLRASTNIVVVADHGMAETSVDRIVFFEDLMDVSRVRIEANGPYGGVRPLGDGLTAATLAAEIRAKAPPQVQVHVREEVPAHLYFRRGDRIPPVVLLCAEGWNIERKENWAARRATYNRGSHGWDPATRDMGTIFVAAGPAFRRGHVIDEVDNVDVYNLLCATLDLQPARNEGTERLVREALR